jgi:predicted nucleic acid-binding protein
MTAVLVDSSVLLDVMTDDPRFGCWSADALAQAADTSELVINPVVYAEVSVRFERIEDLEQALPPVLRREPVPWEAAFLAAKAHVAYRRRGGERLAPLPDFFIGAHAAVAGYRLVTRDPRRVRAAFPRLELIAP